MTICCGFPYGIKGKFLLFLFLPIFSVPNMCSYDVRIHTMVHVFFILFSMILLHVFYDFVTRVSYDIRLPAVHVLFPMFSEIIFAHIS